MGTGRFVSTVGTGGHVLRLACLGCWSQLALLKCQTGSTYVARRRRLAHLNRRPSSSRTSTLVDRWPLPTHFNRGYRPIPLGRQPEIVLLNGWAELACLDSDLNRPI
ncbi:hypothetical protein DEO72_LG4g1349 [Vigna unguiculata]|uniref:Uncharacterized protein n=1 Tax=Vigna unguiculata TaxID=3917 RepID=A0A4D6LQX3_VIGUN|nr:hypothetical protein DEO72_LG4g1349 [Vigna unguiculata]